MKMKYLLIFGSSGLLFNSICCSAHEMKAAHSLALRGICVGLYLWSSSNNTLLLTHTKMECYNQKIVPIIFYY